LWTPIAIRPGGLSDRRQRRCDPLSSYDPGDYRQTITQAQAEYEAKYAGRQTEEAAPSRLKRFAAPAVDVSAAPAPAVASPA